MLKSQLQFSPDAVTVTQVLSNLGAMSGGALCGWASQIFGRRFSIIFMCVISGALVYPYTFIKSKNIMAPAFFEQFAVQGAWGVIPIHIMELSPGSIRTFTVGTAYQLGNLVSSASSTIQSRIGERFPLPPSTSGGEGTFDYGKVICIFLGCVFGYTILVTFFGPENLGQEFDVEHDSDMLEVAGHRTLPEPVDDDDVEKGVNVSQKKDETSV